MGCQTKDPTMHIQLESAFILICRITVNFESHRDGSWNNKQFTDIAQKRFTFYYRYTTLTFACGKSLRSTEVLCVRTEVILVCLCLLLPNLASGGPQYTSKSEVSFIKKNSMLKLCNHFVLNDPIKSQQNKYVWGCTVTKCRKVWRVIQVLLKVTVWNCRVGSGVITNID